ncbi:lymphocyte expansion molecule-like isoform X1 [Carcharodon carcharias]|uniref:lymphocyte expansion molecule-like isoform X1 n=1 Tax=Carcharodon carcharias TaxID=13397 RepID=UPI001B7F5C9D|nr:lymphocyte expansion molecule-like isoform X1 [Carcharodon carcharias]
MEVKQFQGAPFGTQKARFDVYGVHPDRKKQGSYTEVPYDKSATGERERGLAPGYYNVDRGDFSAREVSRKASGPGWARAQEVERFAQTPQLFYKEQKLNKKFLETNLGPGKYEIPNFLDLMKKKNPRSRGICDTNEERFRNKQDVDSPGPGTYGKGGIPTAVLEEKAKKSFGSQGLMDSKAAKNRSLNTVGCDLSPTTYDLGNSIDKLMTRVVSKRGPYDLFTGKRSDRIKTGHLATDPLNLYPGMYGYKSFIDDLLSPAKKRHGKFSTVEQYPFPPVERIFYSGLNMFRPPVGKSDFYDVKQLSRPENRKPPPFLSSTSRGGRVPAKMLTFNPNNVGVGRYSPTKYNKKSVNGCNSSFKSKIQRYLSNMERDKYMQERLGSGKLRSDQDDTN